MRPLDRLPSIKLKLGTIIVGAVTGTTLAILIGVEAGLGWLPSALLAGAVGLAAIQVLARGMTSPLRDMAEAAKAMAEGDYSRRVAESSQDEVGDLARAFNKMSADLAEVDRMRRDLVANVSHELRTPIAALQAVLENLVDGIGAADKQTFESMLVQIHRLARLVDQLLDLSKLESRAIPLQIEEFKVGRLLEQVVRESEMKVENVPDHKVRFALTVTPPELTARGDVERIHQVVANLIENAVRHSPEDGTVRVVGSAASEDLLIQVTDEGPGIPESEREKVFERFYRSDEARSSDDGGSGLGLAIARWIVDLHGGEIEADPNAPSGCCMVVTLPRGSA